MYLFPLLSLYKIFYQHCNNCLYPSLWNIALKDIKNHSPHKITWMEKVSKQRTILHSLHYTVHWNSISHFIGGPRGSDDKHHINSSACHISWLPQWGQHQAVSYWLLCLVIVPASLPLPTSFMHMLWTYSKNKKGQQYLFLFNNFLNKILKHLTYIWYYTTGSLTITRNDKSYSQVLEYMYYICPSCQITPLWLGCLFRHVEHLFKHVEHLFE